MNDTRLIVLPGEHRWDCAQHIRVLEVIWPLLGRHIAFHRRLVDLTSNVKAALLLSQSIYWTRHGRDIADAGGWFLKTTDQWQLETGLSLREQSAAREVLRRLAILNEQRSGIPARLHFRLCLDQIDALLSDVIGRPAGLLDWNDGVAVAELLGPSLAYHRRLAGIGGGVHAGLMLSRALHLTRLQARRQRPEWIGNSESVWTEQIGLTRREIELSRRDLGQIGIWEEMLVGTPPRLLARIRLDCLLALLAGGDLLDAECIDLAASPECGIATFKFRQKGEISMRDSHNHDSTKPPNQFRQNRHYSFDKTAKLSKQRSTRGLVQQPPTRDAFVDEGCAPGGGDLILPEGLLPEERAAALVLVQRCAQQSQALLDELSARMQANAVHTGPISYLRGLVRRALAGEFVPELGQRVAAVRRLHQQEEALRQQREAEEQRLTAECATPEHQAKLATRRAEMRQIADTLQAGRPPEKRS